MGLPHQGQTYNNIGLPAFTHLSNTRTLNTAAIVHQLPFHEFNQVASHLVGLHFVPQVLPAFVYNLVDVVNTVAGCLAVYEFRRNLSTYEADKDTFGKAFMERLGLRGAAARYSLLYLVLLFLLKFRIYYFGKSLVLLVLLVALMYLAANNNISAGGRTSSEFGVGEIGVEKIGAENEC